MPNKRLNIVDSLLAGDLGGTKTNLAIYDLSKSLRDPLSHRTFTNEHFESFEQLLKSFLKDVQLRPKSFSLGVAGPVINEEVALTNIGWALKASDLQKEFDFTHVWLLNDLQASAEALEILEEHEIKLLHKVEADPNGNIAIVAPGTGLGEAFITVEGGKYRAHATEGGHSSFSPRNDLQRGLLKFMQSKYEHVSMEHVCSGTAIPDLYAFMRSTKEFAEPKDLYSKLEKAEDFSAMLFQNALDSNAECEICQQTLRLFVEILANEMSDFALNIGASGGIYLGGGIPPKTLKAFERPYFLKAFFDKGDYRKYLERIPIGVILNDQSPLLGAANYGRKMLAENN